jgi:hypothetical protein
MSREVVVAQKESHAARTEKFSLFDLPTTEFAGFGKKQIDDLVNAQTEFLDSLQEVNRQWFDRMQSEANVASELASRLAAARSIPDAMTAYQDWTGQRFAMMAEDGKRPLDDYQKFAAIGAHVLSNGWRSKLPASALSS